MKLVNKYILIIFSLFLSTLLSCTDGVNFDEYQHTSISGWEKNDTLTFMTSHFTETGIYAINLGLRVNGTFPFTDLRLIVEQKLMKERKISTDTIDCALTDKRGNFIGQGVSFYQYSFPINKIDVKEGDSIRIRVRHDMKREILPGISDIGIKITHE